MPRGGIHSWNLGSFGSNRKICRSFAGFVILARPAHLFVCVCLFVSHLKCLRTTWLHVLFFKMLEMPKNSELRPLLRNLLCPWTMTSIALSSGRRENPSRMSFTHPTLITVSFGENKHGLSWRSPNCQSIYKSIIKARDPWFPDKSTFKDQNGVRWNTNVRDIQGIKMYQALFLNETSEENWMKLVKDTFQICKRFKS